MLGFEGVALENSHIVIFDKSIDFFIIILQIYSPGSKFQFSQNLLQVRIN